MTQTTEAAIAIIFEAIGNRPNEWIRIAEVARITGLSQDELSRAIRELHDGEGFWADPEPFVFRISQEDKASEVLIGGEARHLIRWEM